MALMDINEPLAQGYYKVNNLLSIIWSLISVIGISGNVINLLILPQVQADGGTKVFLTALSLSDLLTAICLITSVIVSRIGWADSATWDGFCKACFILGSWASVTSANFIFVVNLDRFLHVVRPYKYHEIITKKRALVSSLIASTAILVVGLLFVSLSEESFDKFAFHSKNVIYVLDVRVKVYVIISIGIWPLELLVLAMYTRIFCIVRKHATKISAQENAALRLETLSATIDTSNLSGPFQVRPKTSKVDPSTFLANSSDIDAWAGDELRRKEISQHGKFGKFKKQKKLLHRNFRNLRTTFLVTGCYLVSWMPFTILVAIAVFSGKLPHDFNLLVTYTMGKGNCCVNCFVYMFSRSDFKSALLHLFRCR